MKNLNKYDIHNLFDDLRDRMRKISRFKYLVFRQNNQNVFSFIVDESIFKKNMDFVCIWKDFFWRRLSEKEDCVYGKEGISEQEINMAMDNFEVVDIYSKTILHRLRLYYENNKTKLKKLAEFKY